MRRLLTVLAALAVMLIVQTAIAAACDCIICIGDEPDDICILPGCDDEPVVRVTVPPEP